MLNKISTSKHFMPEMHVVRSIEFSGRIKRKRNTEMGRPYEDHRENADVAVPAYGSVGVRSMGGSPRNGKTNGKLSSVEINMSEQRGAVTAVDQVLQTMPISIFKRMMRGGQIDRSDSITLRDHHPMLKTLSEDGAEIVISMCRLISLPDMMSLYAEDSIVDGNAYLLVHGIVDMVVGRRKLATITVGMSIGEEALLLPGSDDLRFETPIARKDCFLL